MNIKRLVRISMLLLATAILAACSSESIVESNEKKNEKETPQAGVIFTTDVPKTEAKRETLSDEDGNAQTRTSITHTPGQGADASWTSDDFIWVKNKNGEWKQSTSITLHHGGRRADFTLPGNASDYGDGCEVRYTGTSITYNGFTPTPNDISFPKVQSRTTANDFSKAGEWGDCGSGTAYNTSSTGKFKFILEHKAAYLCFLPRCEDATLAPNIRLKGIKITANKGTNTNTLFFANRHSFDGEAINDMGHPIISSDITVSLSDFPLYTSANQQANAIYLVVTPDTYDFTIDYIIKNTATNIEGTITKSITNATLAKGMIYDITANLTPIVLGTKYYAWGATKDFWHGYESSQPFINKGEPGATKGIEDNPDPATRSDESHQLFDAYVNYQTPAAPFKVAPNINEAVWYCLKGDPHWDGDQLWTLGGHMHKGGVWIRKKKAIVAYLKNKEGYPSTFTEADMKLGYKATASSPLEDYRITGGIVRVYSYPEGRPYPLDDYFFLPASGVYIGGWLLGADTYGYYWPDNTATNHQTLTHASAFQFFKQTLISVEESPRTSPCRVQAFE